MRVHLPGFRLADHTAAGQITARQLLSHTAGCEGDLLDEDTGPGDDCVQKLVALLDQTPQVFPPGQMFSYNNAAYCVLGRLVEVLRGIPYDECLRRSLLTPLELTHTAPGPHEAIMYRAAHGHIQPTADAEPQPAPIWALPRSGDQPVRCRRCVRATCSPNLVDSRSDTNWSPCTATPWPARRNRTAGTGRSPSSVPDAGGHALFLHTGRADRRVGPA